MGLRVRYVERTLASGLLEFLGLDFVGLCFVGFGPYTFYDIGSFLDFRPF